MRTIPLVWGKQYILKHALGSFNVQCWEKRQVVNTAFISVVPAEPSVTEEKNAGPEQPSTSKNVTEKELEDWLDSMIA